MIKRIQQQLLAFLFFLTNARYRQIRKSGIFDSSFYLAENPDVASSGSHPLVHYFRGGWREGRSPHMLFELSFYFSQAAEIKEQNIEPIRHFINEGWLQGFKPSPYFDPLYYSGKNEDVDFSRTNPLSHFIKEGWAAGRYRHTYIDLQFYTLKYPDVAASGLEPLVHYITIGRKEHQQPGPFFDISWYLDKTPVLTEVAEDILGHYMLFGAVEGKSPSPVFDPGYYRSTYADKVSQEKDPLGHYLSYGIEHDLRPCAWFDPTYYRKVYPESTDSSALAHYLAEGVFCGNYANSEIAQLLEKPVISLLVPVYNVAAHHLNNCIRSVLYQSYPHWQLCLADDCSTSPHVRALLEEWAAKDSRIKVRFLDENLGISGATNAAAALASGEYFAFLDNDDELAPECLFTVVKTITENGADLLYSDEDLIGEDGRRFSVFHKPDFNPELLLCHNYVTHFVVTSKELFYKVGGFEVERAGAQDYDLFLKLSECAGKVSHIPQVLYHWRASETSTSINHTQKEYADEAGRQSVADAMQRRDIDASVEATELKFFYRVRREQYLLPLVSIVIFWQQKGKEPVDWLQQLISLTGYLNFEVILLHDEGCITDNLQTFAMQSDRPIRIIEVESSFGIAATYNLALEYCEGEYVAFVDSNVIIKSDDWLSAMLEYCQLPSTGAVCCKLDFDGAEKNELSPLPDIKNTSAAYFARYLQQASILLNGLQCPQNIWCVARECCVVKKEALDQCGGFAADEFADLFAFADLSFKLQELGLLLYYTPYCRAALHPGSRTMVDEHLEQSAIAEKTAFQLKWRQRLLQGDPFFNLGKLQDGPVAVSDFHVWFAGGDPCA